MGVPVAAAITLAQLPQNIQNYVSSLPAKAGSMPGKAAAEDFQLYWAGDTKIQISGGGATVRPDGLSYENGELWAIDTKHIRNFDSSIYIEQTTPDFLRTIWRTSSLATALLLTRTKIR
jgi:hypothetical protein